jgi:hypothetical protein
MVPLWRGAEAHIQMWEDSSAWTGSYTNEGQRNIRQVCRSARAELVNTDPIPDALIAKWKTALEAPCANSCKGASRVVSGEE